MVGYNATPLPLEVPKNGDPPSRLPDPTNYPGIYTTDIASGEYDLEDSTNDDTK